MKRVRYCGKHATGDQVTVRVTEGGAAGLGGVQSCGSVWACPVCSEKINAGRQSELSAGIAGWLKQGHAVLFGTLTLRHNRGHALADLWDAIGPAWNRVTSGAGVAWNGSKRKNGDIGDKARFGIRGYVRVVETKYGKNGWHPHVHFLLFLENDLTPWETMDLSRRMFGRWETALAQRGFSVTELHGIDLRAVKDAALADYFTKGTYTTSTGAAYEVTGSHSKTAGKSGSRTPFEILADVVRLGDESDLHRWWEWETASKGRRQLTWSRGLRALLALGVELTDEELVEEDNGGDIVAVISKGDYTRLAVSGLVCDVLELAEADDGGRSLRRFLDGFGCVRLEQLTT